VAISHDAQLFNEVYRNYTGAGGYFVANNVYNRLVILDIFGDASIAPDLAECWEALDGGAAYRFQLRRGVRWHDGAPFTSEDVRLTYQTVVEQGYHGAAWLGDIREIATPDPFTVELRLKEPNSGFLAQLGMFVYTHILPAHLYAGTDWATNPTNQRPVGTGPFRFVEWRQGDSILLEANLDYHRGRPAVDSLLYRVMPDRDEALAALARGELDFVTSASSCHDDADLAAKPGVGIMVDPGNAIGYLGFNLRRAPWNDLRVRRALALAVDRDAIQPRVCRYGRSIRHTYLEKVGWAFNPDALLPPRNLAEAEALLDEAGLTRGPEGSRLQGRLVSRAIWSHWGRAAEAVAEQLAPLGIKLQVERLDPVEWHTQIAERHDFDLLVDSGDIGPDPTFLEAILGDEGPRNLVGYVNPEVQALLRRGKAALDHPTRGAAYRQVQTILARDLPRIYLLQHPLHQAYRTEWQGWSWDDSVRGTLPFWSHERVKPARP
jgi:peptide/nickel transport system substrate-binding protein